MQNNSINLYKSVSIKAIYKRVDAQTTEVDYTLYVDFGPKKGISL